MPASAVPEQIHRYRVLSELGRGSTGRVYLAFDPSIDRRIALKVLAPERLRGGDFEQVRRRFLREGRAAGGLNHPGIVTVYDADTDPASGCPYLAMEWVAGCSLRNLLHRQGRLAAGRAVSLAAQVAGALDYAHRYGVVHRDVKPANLLIAGDDRVKVVDFGIAKLLSKSAIAPGRVLGSPYYMAPEQVQGLRIDGRTDLFALGAVLYECLTGRKAFSGDDVAQVTRRILIADPRPIEISGVPASLRAVVDRALEKLPRHRYQTGAELAAALRAAGAELTSGDSPGLGTGPPASSRSRSGGSTTEALSVSTEVIPFAAAPAGRFNPRWYRAVIWAVLVLSAGILGHRPEQTAMPVAEPAADARTAANEPVRLALRETPGPADPIREPPRTGAGMVIPETVGPPGDPAAESSPPVAVAPARDVAGSLEIIHQNRLKLAYLSVWIDGEKALSVELRAKNPFGRMAGREHRWTIPVPEGRRRVEIHLSGVSKPLEARKTIHQFFSTARPRQLRADLRPGSEELSLVWQAPRHASESGLQAIGQGSNSSR